MLNEAAHEASWMIMEFLGTTLVFVGCAAGRGARLCGEGGGMPGSLARTIHHAAGVQLGEVDVLTRSHKRARQAAPPIRIYHAHHWRYTKLSVYITYCALVLAFPIKWFTTFIFFFDVKWLRVESESELRSTAALSNYLVIFFCYLYQNVTFLIWRVKLELKHRCPKTWPRTKSCAQITLNPKNG